MATSETQDGPTPNGGVRSTVFFQDKNGQPIDRSQASRLMIVEYDKSGNSINRTYGPYTPED